MRSIVHRMIVPLVIALLAFSAESAGAQSATPQQAIRALLTQSAAAWNRADLTAFMQSYENSPDTTYVSSRTIIRGYANIRRHYASAYSGAMGRLSFSDLSIRIMGSGYAVVVARWHLALPNAKRPTGLFSLVLHRASGGWKIITDHSP